MSEDIYCHPELGFKEFRTRKKAIEAADFRPVGLDTQIMVTWSVKDAMNDEMVSYFNSDYQESYVITPVTTFHLTPDTEKPFSMDDFPERFSHWLERFTKLITNNF